MLKLCKKSSKNISNPQINKSKKNIKNLKFKDMGDMKSSFIYGFKMEAILKGWDGKTLE